MLRYDQLKRIRRRFLALSGLTPREFKILLPAFTHAYQKVYPAHKTLAGKRRNRQAGGRRTGALDSLEQKLLFVLVYQKTYPVQALLGTVVGLCQPHANYWIHRLLPLLKLALDELGVLPERDPALFAWHERQHHVGLDFTIDGTERCRQRPKNPEKQALHYRRKKKVHSDKNLLIASTKTKRVGYLSQTYAGKTHNKKIADTEPIVYPRGAKLRKDTGFQRYEPRSCQTYRPKKSLASAS